jgi:hypothetical protein
VTEQLPSFEEMNKVYADSLRKVADLVERGDYHMVEMHNNSTYALSMMNGRPLWRTFYFSVEYYDEKVNNG